MIRVYIERYENLDEAKRRILDKFAMEQSFCGSYYINYNAMGKPLLFSDGEQCGEISVSHTDGVLAIAFSDESVGIDIERKDRKISDRICADIRQWTRIEAYAKWTGAGLSKRLIAEDLPQDLIITRQYGDYYVSVCSLCKNIVVTTLI